MTNLCRIQEQVFRYYLEIESANESFFVELNNDMILSITFHNKSVLCVLLLADIIKYCSKNDLM